MKILEKIKELFTKTPKEHKPEPTEPQNHHHNHGSSTT
jgi:hypothetical protein